MEKVNKPLVFYNYVQYLFSLKNPYESIAKQIKYVRNFLEESNDISKKEYNLYKKTHMSDLLDSYALESICNFLCWYGVGFRTANKKKEVTLPLEKLIVVSRRNQQNINDFLTWLHENFDYSNSTYKSYRDTIKSFFEYSQEFNFESVKRYIKALEAMGRSPKTLRIRITGLEKYGEFMKKSIKISRPRIPKNLNIENVPTENEYKKILDYFINKNDYLHYLWIKILGSTGVRCSEFLQIKWEHILIGDVVLKCKGNKYRRIFFSEILQKEVKDYIEKTNASGYVAMGRFGLMSGRGLNIWLKKVGNQVGISHEKMHLHAFRHFFAKMYLKKTKDVVQLADILGHGSIDTTRIYLQKSYEEQRREICKNVNW